METTDNNWSYGRDMEWDNNIDYVVSTIDNGFTYNRSGYGYGKW